MGQDYRARFPWSEEQLAADALKVRREYGYRDNELCFDILECLRTFRFTRNVPVEIFDWNPGDDLGIVTYEPLRLKLAKHIFNGAETNDEESRDVIAHEIAHLRLHSDGWNSFSPFNSHDERGRIKELSVEWQAHNWSGYLLLTDQVVGMFDAPEQIAEFCKVGLLTAQTRLNQLKDRERRQAARCLCDCGEFKLRDGAGVMRCRFCNH